MAKELSQNVLGIKRWRHAMRAAGRCIDCGRKAARKNGKVLSRCRPHLDLAAKNMAKYHVRSKHLCWCGDKVGIGARGQTVTRCQKHHELAIARSRRYLEKHH